MRCVSVDAPKLRCRFARGPDDLVVALLLHDLAGLYESIGRYSCRYRAAAIAGLRSAADPGDGVHLDARLLDLG